MHTVDLRTACEEFKGWVGKLRRALKGADVSQAREAMRQIGGTIVLKPHTELRAPRTLEPHQTPLDGKGIKAGEVVGRYLVASFTRTPQELPIDAALSGEWFRTTGVGVSALPD